MTDATESKNVPVELDFSAEPDFDCIVAAVKRGADECDNGDDMDAFESLAMIRAHQP